MGGPASEVAPYGLRGALTLGGKFPGALKVPGKCPGAAMCLCAVGAASGSCAEVRRVGRGRESFSCFSLAYKNKRIHVHNVFIQLCTQSYRHVYGRTCVHIKYRDRVERAH